MGIKTYKPTSPGRRFQTSSTFEEITERENPRRASRGAEELGRPQRAGRMTCPASGRRAQAQVPPDRFQAQQGWYSGPSGLHRIRPEPFGQHRPAALCRTGRKALYPGSRQGSQVGDTLVSGAEAEIRTGNALPLRKSRWGPTFTTSSCNLGQGRTIGQERRRLCAAHGQGREIRADQTAIRRGPDGASGLQSDIGQVGNLDHENLSIGKAGRNRWLGKRPHVRGVAMNPVDHPHGGGEGKSSGGRHPVTPWGVPTKGYKTGPEGQ